MRKKANSAGRWTGALLVLFFMAGTGPLPLVIHLHEEAHEAPGHHDQHLCGKCQLLLNLTYFDSPRVEMYDCFHHNPDFLCRPPVEFLLAKRVVFLPSIRSPPDRST